MSPVPTTPGRAEADLLSGRGAVSPVARHGSASLPGQDPEPPRQSTRRHLVITGVGSGILTHLAVLAHERGSIDLFFAAVTAWVLFVWARAMPASASWAAHNVIAHPLLVLCPPVGEWLHARTEP